MKSKIRFGIAVFIALFSFGLASCQKLTENYKSEWECDDTHHWHSSVHGYTDQVSEKAMHDWNACVIKEPTETECGEKTFACTVCGATRTETIPAISHCHTFDTEWSCDGTHHWHNATCGHTGEFCEKCVHTWDSGVITKEPTETECGVKTYTCTVCNAANTESIPMLSCDCTEWSHSHNGKHNHHNKKHC